MLNNKAVNQCVEWYLEMGTTHPGYSTDTRSVANVVCGRAAAAVAAASDNRDPMLVSFEKHLTDRMDNTDFCLEKGVYLFNVNKVAYVVEGSNDESAQRTTRNRVNKGISKIRTFTKTCPRSGKGQNCVFIIYYVSFNCDLSLILVIS
jgi:hypothetical protein